MPADALDRATKIYLAILYSEVSSSFVNIILSEVLTYKPLSPIELEQFNVTRQKSDQKWHR